MSGSRAVASLLERYAMKMHEAMGIMRFAVGMIGQGHRPPAAVIAIAD